MNITLLWSVNSDGKIPTKGITGVTDVVAATFNTLALLARAKKLYIVRDNASALRALKMFPGSLLVGESTEPGLPFICPNSPPKVMKLDVTGKTVIQKTNNGTTAVADAIARGASPVFAFHWANLATTAKWLTSLLPSKVTLIASGGREEVFKPHRGHLLEDWYCAEALKKILQGEEVDYENYFKMSRQSILKQYPKGDPSAETLDLVLQKKEVFAQVVPLFQDIGQGVYKVANIMRVSY